VHSCPRSAYPEGYATTIAASDLPFLQEALAIPADAMNTPAAGL
jgi:hypothetical protein